MAEILEVIPNAQNRYLDPFQQKVFKFNTTDSRVFATRSVNSLLLAIGNNIVLSGLDTSSISIINTNEIQVVVKPGWVICDQTCLNINQDSTLVIDCTTYDPSGKVIVYIEYKYIESLSYRSSVKLKIAYVDIGGNITDPFFDPNKSVVLDIIKFEKDPGPDLSYVYQDSTSTVTINGQTFSKGGYDSENVHIDKLFGRASGVVDYIFSPNGPNVDYRDYSTSTNHITLQDMLNTIGNTPRTLVFSPAVWTLDDDVTIPENITCWFVQGAVIRPINGHKLTINGPIIAGDYTVFDVTTSDIVLNNRAAINVNPRWFNATGDGISNDSTAFTNAISSILNNGGSLDIKPGNYLLNSDLVVPDNITLNFNDNAILIITSNLIFGKESVINANKYQIFNVTTGSITNLQKAYPEWFATQSELYNNAPSVFSTAINSLSNNGELILSSNYEFNDQLIINKPVVINCINNSKINYVDTGLSISSIIKVENTKDVTINNLKLISTESWALPTAGLEISNTTDCKIRNMYIDNFKVGLNIANDSNRNIVTSCEFINNETNVYIDNLSQDNIFIGNNFSYNVAFSGLCLDINGFQNKFVTPVLNINNPIQKLFTISGNHNEILSPTLSISNGNQFYCDVSGDYNTISMLTVGDDIVHINDTGNYNNILLNNSSYEKYNNDIYYKTSFNVSDLALNEITVEDDFYNNINTGDPVRVMPNTIGSDVPPSPILSDRDYYVIKTTTSNIIKLADSITDSFNNVSIDITDSGSGINFIYKKFSSWSTDFDKYQGKKIRFESRASSLHLVNSDSNLNNVLNIYNKNGDKLAFAIDGNGKFKIRNKLLNNGDIANIIVSHGEFATIPPTSSPYNDWNNTDWYSGSIVYNFSPATYEPTGWICTVLGSYTTIMETIGDITATTQLGSSLVSCSDVSNLKIGQVISVPGALSRVLVTQVDKVNNRILVSSNAISAVTDVTISFEPPEFQPFGIVGAKAAEPSADSPVTNVSSVYVQSEVQSILDEIRDLKNKLRDANILKI